MESQRIKKANLLIMKAETELEDELFQLGQQEESSFTMVNNIRSYDDTLDPADGVLTVVYIRYDNKYLTFSR